MNIFAVDPNPYEAAKQLCDKHVVKMVVETAQILSTCLRSQGVCDPLLYRPTHQSHPCVLWVGSSEANFNWVLAHLFGLLSEYTVRYGRVHKTQAVADRILELRGLGRFDHHTEFVQCMPEQYRGVDPVRAYHRYYLGDKARFCKWKNGSVPSWFW